jgi:hypothetical protein
MSQTPRGDGVAHDGGAVVGHDLHGHAEPPAQLVEHVDGHSARLPGRPILGGENEVAPLPCFLAHRLPPPARQVLELLSLLSELAEQLSQDRHELARRREAGATARAHVLHTPRERARARVGLAAELHHEGLPHR